MSAPKDGGPAFPAAGMTGRGMTLLDYFAAQALPMVLSRLDSSFAIQALSQGVIEGCCFTAYEIAEGMLKARRPQ